MQVTGNAMDEELEYFLENFGPAVDAVPASQLFFETYADFFPENYINFVRELGFSGFSDGVLWCTDPMEYKPVTDAWLDRCPLYRFDEYVVFARTAFGGLYLWGKNSGNNIKINTLDAIVTTSPSRKIIAQHADLVIGSFFANLKIANCDFEDIDEKKLFARACKKLGNVNKDEMYGFEPALSIGGLPELSNLEKVDIIPHLVLLAQLSDIQFNHIDVSRNL